MKIHLTNKKIYNIPRNVRCANIQIAISDLELDSTIVDIWEIERTLAFKRMLNKKGFCEFIYIGYENIKRPKIQIRLYWFIYKFDLCKCFVELEEWNVNNMKTDAGQDPSMEDQIHSRRILRELKEDENARRNGSSLQRDREERREYENEIMLMDEKSSGCK